MFRKAKIVNIQITDPILYDFLSLNKFFWRDFLKRFYLMKENYKQIILNIVWFANYKAILL
jgi:hypothetical protein